MIADSAVPEGDHVFSFEFKPTGKPDLAKGKGVPATITLYVDGKSVGKGDLPVTIPMSLGLAAGVCIGADAGSPIMDDEYPSPFRFTGVVKKALIDVSGDEMSDADKKVTAEAYLKAAMARQ